MATVTKPIALDESFNTTEVTPRNIADVLAEELSRITGRNASQVEYDNTESGLDADNVQDALDEIVEDIPTVPSVDIQTAVDEFETYNGGILDSLKVALSPNQDLHGYDSPWVGGSRKNKFDILSYTTLDPYVTVSDGNIRVNGSGSFRVARYNSIYLAQGTYTLSFKSVIVSGTEFIAVLKSDDTFIFSDNGVTITNYSRTFTIPENGTYKFAIGSATNDSADITFSDIQIELGSTATAYEPYENICPISGHTQVDVDVSDGQATQEQVTVNLGGTYYSGTLDVVTGVFTVVGESVKGSSLTWIDATAGGYQRFRSNATLANAESNEYTVDLLKCSKFDTNRNAIDALDADGICIYGKYIYVRSKTTTSLAEFQTLIADADICYTYATPTPIQLSPTMVKALVGENHLSAPLDGQEITESKYKQMFTFDDVIAYIQSLS